jgi:cobalamin biosynthesis protein CobD/CbiB
MAMAAGLLRVQLDKPGVYALGATLQLESPVRADLQRALVLCRRAGQLALVATACVLWRLGGGFV